MLFDFSRQSGIHVIYYVNDLHRNESLFALIRASNINSQPTKLDIYHQSSYRINAFHAFLWDTDVSEVIVVNCDSFIGFSHQTRALRGVHGVTLA